VGQIGIFGAEKKDSLTGKLLRALREQKIEHLYAALPKNAKIKVLLVPLVHFATIGV